MPELGDLYDRLEDGPPSPPEDISLDPDAQTGEDDEEDAPFNLVDESKLGPLLDKKPPDACALALKLWNDQNRAMNRRKERWKANKWRREGIIGVQVRGSRLSQDRSDLVAWAPSNAGRMSPSFNKLARLCRRLVANIFADPPTPDAQPDKDTDEARGAAELATRVIDDLSDEAGINLYQAFRDAADTACTYDSGFVHLWWDSHLGGHRPVDVMACPAATDAKHPEIDPTTGQEWEGDYVLKYVAKDGKTLTAKAGEAALQWVGALGKEILNGKNVRFLPQSAQLADAQGILIARFLSVGELKARFADTIGKLTPSQIRQMTGYRPERYRDLLPDFMAEMPSAYESTIDEGQSRDDALAFVLTVYYRVAPQYPKGCYFVLAGNKQIAYRSPHVETMEDGTEEPMDIPAAQFRSFREGEDDPYSFGLAHVLGSANENRSAQIGAWIEHLDRFNNRKTFVPITSTYQPKHHLLQTATTIPINTGGEPRFEQIPEFPRAATDMIKFATDEMNDESGLQEAAQGLQTPDIKSGIHARYVIEQVSIGLSDLKQNWEAGIKRLWRVGLQLLRANATQGQKIRWLGEDGAYKEKEWSRSDLGSIRDVDIAKGSFTLMSPSVKASVAQELFQADLIDKDAYKDSIIFNTGGLLDLEDDPILERVKRQIGKWKDGPGQSLERATAQWTAQKQQQGPQMVPPGQTEPEPSPMQAAAQQLFSRLAIDLETDAAQVRHHALRRMVASSQYLKVPVEWQQAILAEYEAMRQAAGIQTLEEQSQANQSAQHEALLLKEVPQIRAQAAVSAQNVAQFEQAVAQGYQPPAPGQAPQAAPGGAGGTAPAQSPAPAPQAQPPAAPPFSPPSASVATGPR